VSQTVRRPGAATGGIDQLNVGIGQELFTVMGEFAGTIERVVTGPTLARLTHVIVGPAPPVAPKLVPIGDIDLREGELTLLDDTAWPDGYPDAETSDIRALDPVLAEPDAWWPAGGVAVWPYLDTEVGPWGIVREELPSGEVSIGVGAQVTAVDGPIGRVAGFIAEPQAERAMHLVLRHGHLWGRKTVLIPVEHVRATAAGDVEIDLTSDELARFTLP